MKSLQTTGSPDFLHTRTATRRYWAPGQRHELLDLPRCNCCRITVVKTPLTCCSTCRQLLAV